RGVAFDLPGFGLAERPPGYDYSWTSLGRFCAAAVDELGLGRFHLVVHDIGGPVGFELATAMPVAFGTAHDALFEFGRLQPGETALIQAGAGGVGIAAIQLASRAGAQVLATGSSDGKLARLAELGLDHGINYRTTDFAAEVRRLTGGHGTDVILDGVGGQVLADSLRCLAYRGRCVSFGDAGRQHGTPLDISGLRQGNQSLTGYFLGAELIAGHRAHDMIAGLLDDVAAGQLRAVIDRTFPLAEAAAAHAYAESRQAFGRILLKP
ncbi:MAG: alpha/beta fold hydrolase, partial [Micromonosporaceae bacterium]